jgi:hypothetical protein
MSFPILDSNADGQPELQYYAEMKLSRVSKLRNSRSREMADVLPKYESQ